MDPSQIFGSVGLFGKDPLMGRSTVSGIIVSRRDKELKLAFPAEICCSWYPPTTKPLTDKEFFMNMCSWEARNSPTPMRVVRRDIKYIFYPEHGFEVVYDLKKDPHEKFNVAASPKYVKKTRELRNAYQRLRQMAK